MSKLTEQLLSRRELSALMEDAEIVSRSVLASPTDLEAIALKQHVHNLLEACSAFTTHVSRASRPAYREYSGLLRTLGESVRTAPTPAKLRLLEVHAAHASSLLKKVASARPHQSYLEHALQGLGISLLEGASGEKFKQRHQAFVKELEQEFDISPEFVEFLNEGVFITVSMEDHRVLSDSDLREFSHQHSYIMVKRGDPGSGSSKWGFVWCEGLNRKKNLQESLPKGVTTSGSPFLKRGKWFVPVSGKSLTDSAYCFDSGEILKRKNI